ncbi:uncharacterized protein LOC127002828 [Eriocheir sinensis]|uniref:uncharacterized protein LOC127002828 n=1 Tax=Eriocheir sinensis TaxID=95602 RepID=UPI0021C98BFD|nr:uncharacterized protein LOC127002828 [Eriocheir sinensis]
MIEDTIQSLSRLLKANKRVLLVGDFKCKEVNWETFESGGNETAWGERFLRLTMENLMMQWVTENTRYRNDDEPVRLDLVPTKGMHLLNEFRYGCPHGKSDHVIIEMETGEEGTEGDESYKRNRRNYRKADMENIKKYYGELNLEKLKRKCEVQEKYIFMEAYETGVMKYVPLYKPKEKGKNDWFNARCADAKEKRDKAWKRLKRNKNQRNKEDFKIARNEYVKIRREKEKGYEKDIVEKCKEEPKLFYRFINGKIKPRKKVGRLKDGNKVIKDSKDMTELLNKRFQQVFTKDSLFNESQDDKINVHMDEVIATKEDI